LQKTKFLQSIAKDKTLSEMNSSRYELLSKVYALTENDIRLGGEKVKVATKKRPKKSKTKSSSKKIKSDTYSIEKPTKYTSDTRLTIEQQQTTSTNYC
jgi:hypothetical protein